MSEPYILFQVGGADYAIPSSHVQQVEMVEQITRVPNTAKYVEGIVYLRGQVIPVIHLRRLFGLEPIPFDLRSRLLVVRIHDRILALAVDTAREFVRLDSSEMLPPPENLAGQGLRYIQGIIHQQDRLVLIVNLDRLLKPEESQAISETASSGN